MQNKFIIYVSLRTVIITDDINKTSNGIDDSFKPISDVFFQNIYLA